jgi:CRISPR-associated endonuclease Cas1
MVKRTVTADGIDDVRIVGEGPALEPDYVDDVLSGIGRTFNAGDVANDTVAVVAGHGVSVGMWGNHLRIRDGHGASRRERTYNRAVARLRRVLVVAQSGSISLDALAWCQETGIAITVVDGNGALLATSPRNRNDARLRRQQALAGDNAVGLSVAVYLLTAKLAGQAQIADERLEAPETAQMIRDVSDALPGAGDIDELRQLEATAAAAYWSAWVGNKRTSIRFARRDVPRIPEHWLRFDGRRSLITASSKRRAERPLTAIQNYCLKLAQVETRNACLAVGLDPGLGIVHLDAAGRDSFVLDLMEPIRPAVDRFVLDLINRRAFTRGDFAEAADGYCRLMPIITQELAATLPTWAQEVAPHAEKVARMIGAAVEGKMISTTPLTGSKYRAAQSKVKARKAQWAAQRSVAQRGQRQGRAGYKEDVPALPLTSSCLECGGALARGRHLRCPDCWAAQPGQDQSTRARRGKAIAASRAELERWKAEHTNAKASDERFEEAILPGLAKVKLADIMAACGVAKSTASTIRSGQHIPARRHWNALEGLGGRAKPEDGNNQGSGLAHERSR